MAKENNIESTIVQPPATNSQEDLRVLVEKSIKLSEEVYEQNKKISKRLKLMVWGGYFKLFLIIIPIIIGIIYLPAYLSQIFAQYKDVLGIGSGLSTEQLTNIASPGQLKEIMNLLK